MTMLILEQIRDLAHRLTDDARALPPPFAGTFADLATFWVIHAQNAVDACARGEIAGAEGRELLGHACEELERCIALAGEIAREIAQ